MATGENGEGGSWWLFLDRHVPQRHGLPGHSVGAHLVEYILRLLGDYGDSLGWRQRLFYILLRLLVKR